MNDSYVCKKGMDVSEFEQFEQVYSGHFHTPSKQGKITYLGAPYQQTFHDAGGTRGYYIFEDGQLELVEFNDYPHFVKMNTENISKSQIEGNIVKLMFEFDYGSRENQIIVDSVMEHHPHQLHIDFSKVTYEVDDEPEEEMVDMIDHSEIVRDFVGKIDKPKNIKDKTLLDIMFKLMEEIKNE